MKPTPDLSKWIYRPRPNSQARLRLICFPYAGGGASIFRTWPAHLPRNVDVWAVRLPGRENRLAETPHSRITPLIENLTALLRPHLTVPYALFGHSLGALVSFELARRVRQDRLTSPVHLFVSGRQAPQIPDPDPPLHHLPETEFVQQVKHYNGIPEAVFQEPELLQLMIPLLRADFAVNETYHYTPQTPLNCPISAFGGEHDATVPVDDLKAWQVQTTHHFKARLYAGDHFFLRPAQASLLRDIVLDLTTAQINP
ncbi:MAG: thioesterase [Anaerolineae bacterium]|nr:thioesterase [Anaerolineae bacterium]